MTVRVTTCLTLTDFPHALTGVSTYRSFHSDCEYGDRRVEALRGDFVVGEAPLKDVLMGDTFMRRRPVVGDFVESGACKYFGGNVADLTAASPLGNEDTVAEAG